MRDQKNIYKRNRNGIEKYNSVRFTGNDFNYINCKLIAAGKNKIDIQKLETMNAREVENLILFLTDFIGYDYKTDDIDEEGKIADAIIEKLLYVLFDRKGETPVRIEADSTCEKPNC